MKSFKEMYEDAMTTADAGIPDQTRDAMFKKKKRKSNILTRNFIEIAGKRKRLTK
jgi:hypothetical protein